MVKVSKSTKRNGLTNENFTSTRLITTDFTPDLKRRPPGVKN